MGTDDPINTRPDGWAALPGRHHERTTRGRSVGHRRAPLRFPIGTSMDHALRDARTRKRMLVAAQCAIEGHARDEVLLVEVLLGRDRTRWPALHRSSLASSAGCAGVPWTRPMPKGSNNARTCSPNWRTNTAHEPPHHPCRIGTGRRWRRTACCAGLACTYHKHSSPAGPWLCPAVRDARCADLSGGEARGCCHDAARTGTPCAPGALGRTTAGAG